MYRFILVFVAAVVLAVSGEHLQVGVSVNNTLGYAEDVRLNSIPFTVRTKNVFYNRNDTRVIKGISAIDFSNTKAKATITSGGVGFTFTNVRIKGERGEGLNFHVEIFV